MKIVIYKHDDISRIADLINSIPFKGFEQANAIAEIGKILDSGMIKNRSEGKEDKNDSD